MNLKTMFSTVLLSLFLVGSANGESKTSKVHDWMCSKPKESEDIVMRYHGAPAIFRTISNKEDISKLDYPWRWDHHKLSIIMRPGSCENISQKMLYVDVRQYQVLTTPKARQYIEYSFEDFGADGTIEKKARSFETQKSDNGKSWYYIMPMYPEGFVSEKWNPPSDKEAKKVYNSEINFWANQIDPSKLSVNDMSYF